MEHKLKKYLSYIFPSLLISGIIIICLRKIIFYNSWNGLNFNPDVLIIVLYLLWIIYELKASGNDVKQKSEVSDRGTREFYGLSQSLTILSALWFGSIWKNLNLYHIVGFILFISGGIFRIWAIQTLGKYYSHIVRKIDGHKIIDTGPYRYIRHPAYTGMIIAHIGITIFYFNYFTLGIFLIMLIPAIIVRIAIEEKALLGIEGYVEYSKYRKRIVPFIW